MWILLDDVGNKNTTDAPISGRVGCVFGRVKGEDLLLDEFVLHKYSNQTL